VGLGGAGLGGVCANPGVAASVNASAAATTISFNDLISMMPFRG
jgi:hypothetical protein